MTTVRRLSLDEFLEKPDTKPASEWVCGEVYRKPMPDNPHSVLQGYIWMLLHQFLSRARLGRVRIEWRCTFGSPGGERVYIPDVAYVSFERMPPGDTRDNPYPPGAPDLAIEVLSRGQHAGRFASKLDFYLRHGVRLVWVVDPRREVISVFRPGQDEAILHVGDTLDGGDVLPGFSVPVAEIMAQLQE